MRRVIGAGLGLAVLAGGIGWWITRPVPVPPEAVADVTGDASHGEEVFWAAGCASCHMAPDAKGEAQLVLSGGQRFETPFGTFVAPNISPSPAGIGGWTLEDFASAVTRGVSPSGQHYYPAFPYASYTHMRLQDVADLKAFFETLPPSDTESQPHEVPFPFSIRASIGAWKLLNLRKDWVMTDAGGEEIARGRYLVEALAHCGECHTPRDALGGLDRSAWLEGAPNPSGEGRIPGITPAQLDWSQSDIAYYLETGFTPDFDSAGGHMAHVVANFARLPASDRNAVAAYLKALN
ncbi:Cytochrome c, mono-and diheme variants [Poseidonocella pacifica]|uniref:Cytochrome c, mono-and diheme variants n=1 Tax=Poseidonocella pacifica TaxID=871651 RepID=A0A1I0XMU9_9RHOB|nr:cytochrome c [Poseidonocella pacifica]SFB01508.1 Cytochrome c, mono-and diheme variants [Poseidonocella pacifica]